MSNNPKQPSLLSQFFNAIHPISKEAMDYIDKETFTMNVGRGKFIVEPGSENANIFLVVKGVFRGFIVEEGKEITTWINEENEIVGSIRNLGLDLPSEEYVQAIENSEVIVIPMAMINHLYENFPEANIVGRKILEENYRGAEERAYINRIPSADKKYQRFVTTRGSLLNRIPLKYIASFLDMTPETMSRVRSRKGSS